MTYQPLEIPERIRQVINRVSVARQLLWKYHWPTEDMVIYVSADLWEEFERMRRENEQANRDSFVLTAGHVIFGMRVDVDRSLNQNNVRLRLEVSA